MQIYRLYAYSFTYSHTHFHALHKDQPSGDRRQTSTWQTGSKMTERGQTWMLVGNNDEPGENGVGSFPLSSESLQKIKKNINKTKLQIQSWSNNRIPVPNFTAVGRGYETEQSVDSISRLKFLKACSAQAKMLWKPVLWKMQTL